MGKHKNNLSYFFFAIFVTLFSIVGFGGDAFAENRYLAQEGAVSNFFDGYPIDFVIPFAQIKIDGDKSDWDSIEPVLIDGLGDMDLQAEIEGADIDEVYIAHDGVFLYVLITLDGPPVQSRHVQYGFEANNNPYLGGDDTGQKLAYAHFIYGSWSAGVHERNKYYDNIDYPASYVGIGQDFIEWKVLLADMGNLNGKYAWSYIHAYPWGDLNLDPDLYPVSDLTEAVVRMIYKDW